MLGGPASTEYLGGPKCLGGPNFNGGTSNPCRNPVIQNNLSLYVRKEAKKKKGFS